MTTRSQYAHRAPGAIARRSVRRSRADRRRRRVGSVAAADALGQREQRVLARCAFVQLSRLGVALPSTTTAPSCSRAHDRHLARVIARRLALLVARLVLLVDDDRAEVLERREDRRARADGDALLAALEREPRVVALAVAQRAVQHGDLVAEHGAEAIDGLRRERDLGHEHDRRLSPLEHDSRSSSM